MPRMLTEEEVRRIEQQRELQDRQVAPRVLPTPKNRINPELAAMLQGTTKRRKDREAELVRLTKVRSKPNYGQGLSEEDKRAIALQDEQRMERLNHEIRLERGIEKKQSEEAGKGIKSMRTYELIESLDDENTPPSLRAKIRKELGGRGVRSSDYDAYRWTDTGVEAREAKIADLQKSFDLAQEEQQKWQELALKHKDKKMRKRYSRWAEEREKELDELQETIDELKSLSPDE